MATQQELKTLIDEAQRTADVAEAAREALGAVLLAALRRLIPEGTEIDLHNRDKNNPPPEYLWGLKTLAGNDRGASRFRIEKVVDVDVQSRHPMLSKWSCDAVPISSTTGKDMKASSGHSGHERKTVRLVGHISTEHGFDEAIDSELQRLVQTFAEPSTVDWDAIDRNALWHSGDPTKKTSHRC